MAAAAGQRLMNPLIVFVVVTVLIPYGSDAKRRLRRHIHPSLLVVSGLSLVVYAVVRWVPFLLLPLDPFGTIRRVVLSVFSLFKDWAHGLISPPLTEGSADAEEECFQDCISDQVHLLDDATGVLVVQSKQHNAEQEWGNSCRSIVMSSDYYARPPSINAKAILQQRQEPGGCFVEEGCLEWGCKLAAVGKGEQATLLTDAGPDDEGHKNTGHQKDSFVQKENRLMPGVCPSEAWANQDEELITDVVLPTDENGSADGELSTFTTLRLTARNRNWRGGIAYQKEPDDHPAALVEQSDAEVDRSAQEREAGSSPFWLMDWINKDAAGVDAYGATLHQAPPESSPAVNALASGEEHEIFCQQHMEKMAWFDQLYGQKTHQAFAVGVAEQEEQDPNVFMGLSNDEEHQLQEIKAASSSLWSTSWLSEDAAEVEGYDRSLHEAPAETWILAPTVLDRDEEHDMFYEQYMKKMAWFDRLNGERIHQASALLKMDLRNPRFLEHIDDKIKSLRGTSVRRLIEGVETDIEQVYVAQSCLGWAVLHDLYRRVESLASTSSGAGGAGHAISYSVNVTGKFQQFRVLLLRYMENERRKVRRPWSYCQGRLSNPNLLQVPDVSEGSGVDAAGSRRESTTASEVLGAIGKAIQVFRDLLESDNSYRPQHGKLMSSLLWRRPDQQHLEDPRDLHLLQDLKKQVRKKERTLKNLEKTMRRWWKAEASSPAALESQVTSKIVFSLVDVKLVSRVLGMSCVSNPQLRWCKNVLDTMEIYDGHRERRLCNRTSVLFPSS